MQIYLHTCTSYKRIFHEVLQKAIFVLNCVFYIYIAVVYMTRSLSLIPKGTKFFIDKLKLAQSQYEYFLIHRNIIISLNDINV